MFLDYLPYMVFTNMFAIFYLETICMTKTTAQKQKDDKWMGHLINIMITAFFVILFALLIIFPTAGLYNEQWDNKKTAPGIGFVDIPNYGPTYVEPFTVFLKGMYSDVNIYSNVLTNTTEGIVLTMTPYKTSITIYDISQVLLCVILFIHQFMVMFVARESALIFIDERQ